MKNITAILLVIISLTACIKDQPLEPVKPSLAGRWLADNAVVILVIRNTEGKGDSITYTEQKTEAGWFLKENIDGHIFTYKIISLSFKEMSLSNSDNQVTHYVRMTE